MGNLLKTGQTWLQAQRHSHMTETATYRRGAASVSLAVSVGLYERGLDETISVAEESSLRDFIICASNLVLDGSIVEPLAGDKIDITFNGTVCTFELMSPGEGPCFRYSDQYRLDLRVHARLIAEA